MPLTPESELLTSLELDFSIDDRYLENINRFYISVKNFNTDQFWSRIDRHGKLDENDAFDDDQAYGLGNDDDHVAIPKVSQKRQMPGGWTNDWVEEFLSIGPMTG